MRTPFKMKMKRVKSKMTRMTTAAHSKMSNKMARLTKVTRMRKAKMKLKRKTRS